MKTSVLMTVYNRPPLTLMNTLSKLARNDLADTEILVVDDGSTFDYKAEKDFCRQNSLPVDWMRISTIDDRPGTYNIDGYNNPAYAWNCALEAASGEIMVMLASDCMIPPDGLAHARRCGKSVWMSCVVDIDSGCVYLGKSRIAPYGWFASWKRSVVGEIRQDEEFLKGIAFDDNDFSARLALASGEIVLDPTITAFHQSHPATAYSDGHRGHDINERYCFKKWGGIPWSDEHTDPLEKEMHHRDKYMVIRARRKVAKAV